MKLPLLVYAAREGYGWISGKDVPDREALRRLCGRMPDVSDGEVFSGIVLSGGSVIAYRFMLESQADSCGRNGTCLVLTRMSLGDAQMCDFHRLFQSPLFSEPLRCPPDSIELFNRVRPSDRLGSKGGAQSASDYNWESVGSALADFSAAELDGIESVRWSRNGNDGRILCRIERKPVQPLESVLESPIEVDEPRALDFLWQRIRGFIEGLSVARILLVVFVLLALLFFWRIWRDGGEGIRRWLYDRSGMVFGSTVEQRKQ